MINEVIRNYEVSLWTLQDEFITVLRWSDVEYFTGEQIEKPTHVSLNQKGTIQDPIFTIVDDGTQQFTFSIPMYIYDMGQLKENPIWYNTRNGNLIMNLRKIKVIFNKGSQENQQVFEFLITKVTEEHEKDQLICQVECEGLAFHELGKIGYTHSLSAADIENDHKMWETNGYYESRNKEHINNEPHQTINYWCEKIGLDYVPSNEVDIDPRRWYFKIDMDWSSFQRANNRSSTTVYEEEFATEWKLNSKQDQLIPKVIEGMKEKERTIEVSESNIYNITQTIAETFQVYCRYEYQHDANYHIIGRTVVFFNNYLHDDHIFSISYPYNATKITRSLDSTDLITQLYVKSVDNSATILGEDDIRYCTANKTQENYIFNFDYLKEMGGITDEQYKVIAKHEAALFDINQKLYPIENKIAIYEAEKVNLEAKLTIYNNSIKIDNEQIRMNSDLYLSLTTENQGNADDGFIGSFNENNPEYTIIQKDTEGHQYISLNNKKKGIKTDTVHVYRSYNPNANTNNKLTNEISGIQFEYDEYGNPTKIYNINVSTDSMSAYMTYDYQPKLYYDAIIKTWNEKLATDEAMKDDIDTQLNHETKGIYSLLESAKREYENKLAEKREIIEEFRLMMGPAIREGNWTPEDYIDYGERLQDSKQFPTTFNNNFIKNTSGESFTLGWDAKLFDGEQDISYRLGVNETIYYPCIDLSPLLTNQSVWQNIEDYSFIFNNNYYDNEANSLLVKNIRSFSIGSEAILGFVKQDNNNADVIPVLILVGAKSMTDEMINHMKNQGHPKIGKLSVNSTNGIVTITDEYEVGANQQPSFINFNSNMKAVMPRIKFSSLMLKVNDQFVIQSNGTQLENYKDYYIRTRNIEDNQTYAPEYLITLKPEAFLRQAKLNNEITMNYSLSNASTAIYLDALEIAKENSRPKVSYTVDPSILNKDIVSTLYSKLNWLVMINDAQLKFKDIFGYISKIELNLDFPNQDRIEIKNYSGKFEDLFTTIIAQTEDMKKNSGLMSALANGTYALSENSLDETLSANERILQAYLDSHFDSSQVVIDRLTDLFNEAGQILVDSSSAIGAIHSLTSINAGILAGFADNIAADLCSHTYIQDTKPFNFKPGDIWIDGNGDHWVATGYSSDNDATGTTGFVRTHDGSLASITGAGMDIDAEKGLIDIYAANELKLRSGKHVYIGADDAVDIVGNQAVNIGGTTINIASEGDSDTKGGINLVSTSIGINNYKNQPNVTIWQPNHVYTEGEYVKQENKYYRCKITHTSGNSWNVANWDEINTLEKTINNAINSTSTDISKVLIHPNKIELGSANILMRGSNRIEMITSRGSLNDTSALSISPSDGIWIGSGAGVTLYAGNIDLTNTNGKYIRSGGSGASVELMPSHILFGVSNGSSATALKMTNEFIILGAGNVVNNANVDNATVTGTSSGLIGAKFTSSSIGFATGSGNNINAILMDNNGITIGSGSIDVTLPVTGNNGNNLRASTGSYIRLGSGGLELGSLADLYVNTDNFKLQTHSRDKNNTDFNGETILAVGKNLQSIGYDTAYDSNTGELRKKTGTNSYANLDVTPTVRLLVNQNGLYISGTVYADAGSFTGDVHAKRFILDGATAIDDFNNVVGATTVISTINSNINNTTKSTRLVYYLTASSSFSTPPSSNTEIVNSTTFLDTWAYSYPQYPQQTDNLLYYYHSVQTINQADEISYSSVIQDYGVTSAAQFASQAKITTESFTENGLLSNYSWGDRIWPVALTSTSNLLIGANGNTMSGGIWIAKSATYSDGAAVVINKDGIAMAGSTISLDADSTIRITSGATIEINANNFMVNSKPSSNGNYFYVGASGDSPSEYFKYTKTGVLEIKGDIHATGGTIGGFTIGKINSRENVLGVKCQESGHTSHYYVGFSDGAQSDTGYFLWAGNPNNSRPDADFSVTYGGSLTAKKGNIGGWIIEPAWLWAGEQANCITLVGNSSTNDDRWNYVKNWALYAGADYPENSPPTGGTSWAPFRVRRNGELYAQNICVGNGPAALNANISNFEDWGGYTGCLYFWVHGKDDYETTDANGNSVTELRDCYKWIKIDGMQLYNTIEAIQTLQEAVRSLQSDNQIDEKAKSTKGCFVKGTLVQLADGTVKPIEQLLVGTKILSYNEKLNQFSVAEVEVIQMIKHKTNIYNIILSSGKIITMTGSHPLLTTHGWKSLDIEGSLYDHGINTTLLKINDILVSTKNEKIYVKDIIYRKDLQDTTVYNCHVSPYHTFIVEDIVVHNSFTAVKA